MGVGEFSWLLNSGGNLNVERWSSIRMCKYQGFFSFGFQERY
jgi:hypothetical protein